MIDVTKLEWKWFWRESETAQNEADCGVYAEPRTGQAYSVCRCPRYVKKEQWEELAAHICDTHNNWLRDYVR
jgi:hypothetical protein